MAGVSGGRLRAAFEVLLVGVVSFGAASAFQRLQDDATLHVPAWVPFLGDPLVNWKPDLAVQQLDERQLKGEMARAPHAWDPPKTADVVVIVLDTVRADRLGFYGYGGGTTPHLDAWAKGARVYDQMVSDGDWTLPSHASLFTGRPAISHGAHGTPLGGDLASPLRKGSATVARALRDAGYRTVGIAANQAFLHSMWGLSQGFDVWLCESLRPDRRRLPYVSGDRITAMAETVLSRPRDAPLFLFLNYMDAHAPWLPRHGYVEDPEAIRRDLLPYNGGWTTTTERLMADGVEAPTAERAWSEAYDSSLRFLDEQVGELLERLPSLGIGPEDYVFLLSDHGEYLGEHHLVEHSKDLYEQVLRVPLAVVGPGYTPGRDATPVQTHDLADRILAAAGQEPLEGAVHTGQLQVSELYYARHRDLKNARYGKRFDRIRRAFRLGPHKLLLGSDDSREAYDLSVDPQEATSVLDAPWVPELEAEAEAWLAAQPKAPPAAAQGAADLETLRALGYVE
jgi:arylsulfatase A-like enzyme